MIKYELEDLVDACENKDTNFIVRDNILTLKVLSMYFSIILGSKSKTFWVERISM